MVILTANHMRHLTPFVRKFAASLTNKSADWNQRNRRKMRKSAKLLLAAFAVLQLMLADETADVSIASRRYVALCTTKVACSFRALVIIMDTDSIAYAAHVVAIRHLPFARPRQTDVRQMTFGFAATARAVGAIDCKMLSMVSHILHMYSSGGSFASLVQWMLLWPMPLHRVQRLAGHSSTKCVRYAPQMLHV